MHHSVSEYLLYQAFNTRHVISSWFRTSSELKSNDVIYNKPINFRSENLLCPHTGFIDMMW